MDTTNALSFLSAAPFIAILISLVVGVITIPKQYITTFAIGLAAAWGGVLWYSGYYSGDAATFIVAAIAVGTSASGFEAAFHAITDPDGVIKAVKAGTATLVPVTPDRVVTFSDTSHGQDLDGFTTWSMPVPTSPPTIIGGSLAVPTSIPEVHLVNDVIRTTPVSTTTP